jgi:hypothetical protein
MSVNTNFILSKIHKKNIKKFIFQQKIIENDSDREKPK